MSIQEFTVIPAIARAAWALADPERREAGNEQHRASPCRGEWARLIDEARSEIKT